MKKSEQIITELLAYSITKEDAIDQLEMLNNVKTANVAEALKEAVSALYLDDSSDYKAALYSVVRHLFQIEDLDYEKIRSLHEIFNDEEY